MAVMRTEYPRPWFKRDEWVMLNGEWEITFDDERVGIGERYWEGKVSFDKRINVPFSYQYPASGIGDTDVHETLWYRRTFGLTDEQRSKRTLVCFNGCNYETDVWINGIHATNHKGAFSPFQIDITDLLVENENVIVVRCIDSYNPALPRGKQSYKGEQFGCWYISNGGIWQSVWLEFFEDDCIVEASITPDIDEFSFSGEIETLYGMADSIEVLVMFEGEMVKKQTFTLDGKYTRYTVRLMEGDCIYDTMYWELDSPKLFYVDFRLLKDNKVVDLAHARFGMREISIDSQGQICLNHRPVYQRLVLDQGYWKESGITPPSAEALKRDILMSKEMGFNGARKHQKMEDPYWYYYADELGFLTWCEMPSAYYFNNTQIAALSQEWQDIIRVAKNFTSVITYVPFNESWGIRRVSKSQRQKDYVRSLYYLTKATDPSRLVSSNDGWENDVTTDVITIHDYAKSGNDFPQRYTEENYNSMYPQNRKLMLDGEVYHGQPVLFSEFGGIALQKNVHGDKWGYGKHAKNEEDFYSRLENLMNGIDACDFQGYCYTQLTDVQQEVNGLLDESHNTKYDFERIKAILVK